MDVFEFRNRLIGDYEQFSRSFTKIRADDIRRHVDGAYDAGRFWPAPLIQLNPNFVAGGTIDSLVAEGLLDHECAKIFRIGKSQDDPFGSELTLHQHQQEAVRIAPQGGSYVLTTGTGSGKSLSYFVPIVDHVLRQKKTGRPSKGITAIVVYPMNALCNSQMEELDRFLRQGYGAGNEPVTFARYTGQDSKEGRTKIAAQPPDILLTNYVMLELIMTRFDTADQAVVEHANGLRFLVLDELHTYRGRQGADVAMLVRRVRERFNSALLCVGTSATMASAGTAEERRKVVASIASRLFGSPVKPENVITETLEPVTDQDVLINKAALSKVIQDGVPQTASYEDLRRHPLAVWVEMNLGLEREGGRPDGKLVRISRPRSVNEAAELLNKASAVDVAICRLYLSDFLLLANRTRNTKGRSLFAFRLHQFVSGAGSVFTTLEAPNKRYVTVDGQQFKPGDRSKSLYDVCFCRECGQEYYPVWASLANKRPTRISPRELSERASEDEDVQFGFYMGDSTGIFDPDDMERYPEEWLQFESGVARLRPNYRKYRPLPLSVDNAGEADKAGLPGWLIPGAFRFCLNPDCRVS